METFSSVFLVWESNSHPKATDTFTFNGDKITRQNIVVTTKKASTEAEQVLTETERMGNPLTCHHPGKQQPDLMAHPVKNPLTCHPLGICHLPGNFHHPGKQQPDLIAHPVKNPLTCHHSGKQQPDLMAPPVKNPLTCHPLGICHLPGKQQPDLIFL